VLVALVFGNAQVRLIRAHTLPMRNAATRVRSKCGFEYIGPTMAPCVGGSEPGVRTEYASKLLGVRGLANLTGTSPFWTGLTIAP
jgi:hypothetical protein